MGTYLRPCGDVLISSSWQDHKNRTPPSAEPGTDYAVPKGTPVHAAADGVIADIKTTTSGATGRYIAFRASDGNYIRYLHLQSTAATVGQQISRGQVIAYSGASGFGSENGYGAHVHTTLWIGDPWVTPTVDFENYVGEEEVEEVPTYNITSVTRSVDQELNSGEWEWLRLNDAGDVSILFGDQFAQETLFVELSGLPAGEQVQARFVRHEPSGDAEGYVTEIVGTSGNTLGQHSDMTSLSSDSRLRVQLKAFRSGVKVANAHVKTASWSN